MILGADFLNKSGIDVKYSTETIQWFENEIPLRDPHLLTDKDYMYLVHSYYAEQNDSSIATTTYDIAYASALQKDNFYGVQFHPEKSGSKGSKILENFLKL